jgi:hypothetical protein
MTDLRRRCIEISLWSLLAAVTLTAPVAVRASGYGVAKVVLAGEAAPGAGGALHGSGFFSVALNAAGEVAFLNDLTGETPSWGAFLYGAAGNAAVSITGESAPGTGGGSYLAMGGFPALNDAGELSFMAVVSGGTSSSGIFADTGAGADVPVVVAGQTAPSTGGGTFEGTLADLNRHALNAAGAVAFIDTVSGGTAASGVFLHSGGSHSAVSLAGDSAPGTGAGVYGEFESPALSDSGDVVFPALVTGGSASGGLFVDAAGVDSALVLVGDTAPGTGGGTFADFLVPEVNASGVVVFLSNVSGSTATGGIFRHADGSVDAVVVENDAAPGTGGGTYATLTSLAALNEFGDIVFSAAIAGGTTDAGLFRFDAATGQIAPVALFGESAPGSGGATFAQFGYVDVNDPGQIAFQATLSDGNSGLFLASPSTPVPATPALALAALAAALLAAARTVKR